MPLIETQPQSPTQSPKKMPLTLNFRVSNEVWFWVTIFVLIGFRFLLTWDMEVYKKFLIHDDALYISRAFHLLMDGTFGAYSNPILVKLPGFSFFLAAQTLTGLSYLENILLLYCCAGVYFLSAIKREIPNKPLLIIVFTLYLLNPITLSIEWYRIIRAPLSISLFIFILGAILFILQELHKDKLSFIHMGVLSVAFAFGLLVREDGVLLYLPVFILMCLVISNGKIRHSVKSLSGAIRLLTFILLPFILTWIGNTSARSFSEKHYGLRLIHDLTEGEFPKLIRVIRSVESKRDNRYVWVSQDRLASIRTAVPEAAPMIDRLPRPGPGTYPCTRFGLCTEWNNGHMVFWIKGAVFEETLGPTQSQAYFRQLSTAILAACQTGKLTCGKLDSGFFPPFEFRWTRALAQEAIRAVGSIFKPTLILPEGRPRTEHVPKDYLRMFQVITSDTHADNCTPAMGPACLPIQQSVFGPFKKILTSAFEILGPALLILGLCIFLFRLAWYDGQPITPLKWLTIILVAFSLTRWAALSYVAIYMGDLDERMYYSLYISGLLIFPFWIAGEFGAWRRPYHSNNFNFEHP